MLYEILYCSEICNILLRARLFCVFQRISIYMWKAVGNGFSAQSNETWYRFIMTLKGHSTWVMDTCLFLWKKIAIGLAGEFGVSDPKYSSYVDRRWGASPLVDQLVVDTCCKNPQFSYCFSNLESHPLNQCKICQVWLLNN